jgi:hypothetical protein
MGENQIGGTTTLLAKVGDFNQATLPQMKAARALLTGQGLALPGAWTDAVNAVQSATNVVGQMNSIMNAGVVAAGVFAYAKNNMPGVALMVGAGVVGVAAKAAGVDENNILFSALSRAQQLVKDPISFLKLASRAQNNAEASFLQGGSTGLLGLAQQVGNLIIGAQTLIDLTTGGVTGYIGPTAPNTPSAIRANDLGITISAADIKRALESVALALRSFGTLFDPTKPELLGTAAGIITSLRDQNIAYEINIDAILLEKAYIDINQFEDLYQHYGEYELAESLKNITGTNLDFIIEKTGVQLYKSRAEITSLADLLNPEVILPRAALDHIPGASLPNFGAAIANWGIRNEVTWEMLAELLANLEIPDCPDINKVDLNAEVAQMKALIPPGSGIFGQAMVKDLIGTAAGHIHDTATNALLAANTIIQNSASGKALKLALEDYDLALAVVKLAEPEGQAVSAAEAVIAALDTTDPQYDYNLSQAKAALKVVQDLFAAQIDAGAYPVMNTAISALLIAMQNLREDPSPAVQNAIEQSSKSTLESALQLVGEIEAAIIIGDQALQFAGAALEGIEKLVAAGAAFGAKSPIGVNGLEAGFFAQLVASVEPGDLLTGLKKAFEAVQTMIKDIGSFGGLSEMIDKMITPDPAGQAIRAMYAEARNRNRLAKAGIDTSRGQPDVATYARNLNARTGEGLTEDQKRIITTDAIFRGLDIGTMLALNVLYGYNKQYYNNLYWK